MNLSILKKTVPYAKVLAFWIILLAVLIETLMRFYLNELPYKFLNHTTGPINRLGQYSKDEVIPNDYVAIVGDSYAYGFGPWLYDNSWSWGQPHFATHHLLHSKTQIDFISFGYPGFGSLGSSLSYISEYQFVRDSSFWPQLNEPEIVLLFFYEGNDLINNLHEIEQRGFDITRNSDGLGKNEMQVLLESEFEKLIDDWSWTDHFATWNLFSGLYKNYSRRFKTTSHEFDSTSIDNQKDQKDVTDYSSVNEENIALINNKEVYLGYSEGPALLLTHQELSLAMEVLHQSLIFIKKNLPTSRIAVVYLPSSLSLYRFETGNLRPAPLSLKGEKRDRLFSPAKATENNLILRKKLGEITSSLQIEFIDPTNCLKDFAKKILLHGPRDPIHFNQKGYEAFCMAILPELKILFETTNLEL